MLTEEGAEKTVADVAKRWDQPAPSPPRASQLGGRRLYREVWKLEQPASPLFDKCIGSSVGTGSCSA